MSHQQIIYVDFTDAHKSDLIRVCSEGIKELTKYLNNSDSQNFKEILSKKIEDINVVLNKIKNNEFVFETFLKNQKLINNFLNEQTEKLSKEISNLIYSFNNEQILHILSSNQKEINLLEYIEKFGYVAYKAFDQLKTENSLITDEILKNKIKEINLQNLNNEELKQYKKITELKITNLFPNDEETQYTIFKILKYQISNNQQLNDFNAWLERKKDTYPRILKLFRIIETRLKKYEDFKPFKLGNENKYRIVRLDDSGFLTITQSYKNKYGEIIDINISEELKINYKIGNDYERHACDKTSNEIFKALEETQNIKIINIKKIRDFYGAKYKTKELAKNKTKEVK